MHMLHTYLLSNCWLLHRNIVLAILCLTICILRLTRAQLQCHGHLQVLACMRATVRELSYFPIETESQTGM